MGQEIINSATPLETSFAGVHPRLFITREKITGLRKKLGCQPYASLFARLKNVAEAEIRQAGQPMAARGDTRGYGCATANLAMAWLLTDDRRYYDAAVAHLEGMAANPAWAHSLLFGHLALGYATAFDWFYDTFDESTRQRYADHLFAQAQSQFDAICTYSDYHSFGYTCNTMPVMLSGLTAAGCALFGDKKGVAPWLRLALEKGHLLADTLGPDGVSPEGVGYGQYYAEFTAKMLALIRDLLGTDLFRQSPWFKMFGTALTYHAFPRKHWCRDAAFFMFGDSARSHWYGPDPHLRLFASTTGDGRAQWLADETNRAGVALDSAAYLNLVWHNPAVKPAAPRDLPTLRHFDDMEIVFMRSGWHGDESVMAIKCGPGSGHRAARRDNHTACGGHMYPDAGGILLFAHGDLLVSEAGYARKMSAYHNVALINGLGQLSEGGDWYEDIEFRKGHPVPFILRVEPGTRRDYVVADATNAYPPAAGLKRYLRHVIFIKPDAWLIVDEFETAKPGRFDVLFHSRAPFSTGDRNTAATGGAKGALAIAVLEPSSAAVCAETQIAEGGGTGHPDQPLNLLRVSSRGAGRRHQCITLLQAYPAGGQPPFAARWSKSGTIGRLTLKSSRVTARFDLMIKRKDLDVPLLTDS